MTRALAGNLGHFQPGEVMQLLQLASATGRLEVERLLLEALRQADAAR